jgi:DNA-binding NtrC family response regulator
MKKEERRHPVLVLGNSWDKAFEQTLSDICFSPTFLNSIEGVLHELHHVQAMAILVDRDQKRADELELILNVRDMDENIPIILIGSTTDEHTELILASQPATFVIPTPVGDPSLRDALTGLVQNTVP